MNTPRRVRIAFVGAGAIGGYVGAHFAKAGLDVTLIDQWPQHVSEIKRNGLHFKGTLGEYSIPVHALHLHEVQALTTRPIDIAFICTKLYDTVWAAALIKDYLAADGFVVTMQNSIVENVVADIVGLDRTVGCIVSTLSAELYAPGHVARTRQPGGTAYTIFRAGELHGRATPRLARLVEILNLVDSAKATSNLWGERWSKLCANTMTTGVCGITGLSLKAILQGDSTLRLVIRLGAESIRVGRALGYDLEPIRRAAPATWLAADSGDRVALAAIQEAIRAELPRMTDENVSGTAQDLRKGRRTEIDFMNGFVAAKGREAGIPASTHERITALVKRAERGELDPHPDNIIGLS